MSDPPFRALASEADWADARSQSADRPVLVFKHSAACSVSGRADRELRRLAEEEDLPVYKLVVQQSRALSDAIADALGVRQETPQAILLYEKTPVFDTSHFDVTVDTLREALPAETRSP